MSRVLKFQLFHAGNVHLFKYPNKMFSYTTQEFFVTYIIVNGSSGFRHGRERKRLNVDTPRFDSCFVCFCFCLDMRTYNIERNVDVICVCVFVWVWKCVFSFSFFLDDCCSNFKVWWHDIDVYREWHDIDVYRDSIDSRLRVLCFIRRK